MTNQAQLKAMKAVYTYFFPEVRRLVHSTDHLADDLFLTTTPVEKAQKIVDSLDFRKRIIVPATLDEKVDLDTLHEPVINRIAEIYESVVPGISDFRNRYFTSGSSEGIFHALAELKAKGTDKIFTLAGEYEGYKEYGKTLGIETREVDLDRTRISGLENGIWFISNPSARDGNIIPNETIKEICDEGHQVYLDLAYVGSTKAREFDASHENIPAVFMSFSKPYGVFRFRVGFTFAREPMDSLYANKWFKDIQRVLTAVKIAEEIGPKGLHERYEAKQSQIVRSLNQQYELNIQPSDALLLGNIPAIEISNLAESQRSLLAPYKRGNGYRLCLTPYYEELENGGLTK